MRRLFRSESLPGACYGPTLRRARWPLALQFRPLLCSSFHRVLRFPRGVSLAEGFDRLPVLELA